MTLSTHDAFRLGRAGFTRKEIAELASATDLKSNPQPRIDLDSPAWQATLKKRINFMNNVRQDYFIENQRHLTRQLYNLIIDQWYSKGIKRSPWDWLKSTYRRPKRKDFQTMIQSREARRSAGRLGTLRRQFRK